MLREQKQELRKQLKQALAGQKDRYSELSSKVSENLIRFLVSDYPLFTEQIIGGFYPLENEEPLWHQGFTNYKSQLAFPYCEHKGELEFFIGQIQEYETVSLFGRNFRIPTKRQRSVTPQVLLVPGLGFTAQGDRIGRGKGFFDRYLNGFSGLKVGVCFQCQVVDHLPTEPHDHKMDVVITENEVMKVTQ